jgi:4-amino-4-deoxy-L-arabinose transferase-like glycosyltransferase
MNSGPDLSAQADQKLVNYLIAQQGSTRYLVATINALSAAPLIIATDKPVMAIGGFLGSDPILTQEKFEQMVKDNTLRFFLVSGPSSSNSSLPQQFLEELPSQIQAMLKNGSSGGMGGPLMGSTNTKITDWVTNHCKAVPENEWKSSGNQFSGGPLSMMGGEKLYDCAGTVR